MRIIILLHHLFLRIIVVAIIIAVRIRVVLVVLVGWTCSLGRIAALKTSVLVVSSSILRRVPIDSVLVLNGLLVNSMGTLLVLWRYILLVRVVWIGWVSLTLNVIAI